MTKDIESVRAEKLAQLKDSAEKADMPSEPLHIADAGELEKALETYQLVLVDFYADWCGPCQMLAPVLEDMAGESPAAIAKVDTDESPALASQYGVRSLPTLVLFADGEVAERLVGLQDRSALERVIETAGEA